eukprot:CAMPEP_0194196056 /NCGR_PEP_ID=MMETSP0154-20130528/76464_1 /TAXON_ID=1049557 /ORGANISM="Thalassiothrix antarctica, Strain L6-D1" /LENGTH=745 /DNA_ID=CAMNT_0038920631 /DNA_START=232 /DNA_END=2469 /DNA_ORIENTATION=-
MEGRTIRQRQENNYNNNNNNNKPSYFELKEKRLQEKKLQQRRQREEQQQKWQERHARQQQYYDMMLDLMHKNDALGVIKGVREASRYQVTLKNQAFLFRLFHFFLPAYSGSVRPELALEILKRIRLLLKNENKFKYLVLPLYYELCKSCGKINTAHLNYHELQGFMDTLVYDIITDFSTTNTRDSSSSKESSSSSTTSTSTSTNHNFQAKNLITVVLESILRSSSPELHSFAPTLYHSILHDNSSSSEQSFLSLNQYQRLLGTCRKKISIRGEGVDMNFYVRILQDFVTELLTSDYVEDPKKKSNPFFVNPGILINVLGFTYPFTENGDKDLNTTYVILQTLLPLFVKKQEQDLVVEEDEEDEEQEPTTRIRFGPIPHEEPFQLDRGMLQHILMAASKRGHQDLALLVWDLNELWGYTPTTGCFESMIHTFAKGRRNDNDVIDCFSEMIRLHGEKDYRPLIRSISYTLRASANRCTRFRVQLFQKRKNQNVHIFNSVLSAYSESGNLHHCLKLLDTLRIYDGVEPNADSYSFVMEALAVHVQNYVNRPKNALHPVQINQRVKWLKLADQLWDEMMMTYEIPINTHVFHQYVRMLTLLHHRNEDTDTNYIQMATDYAVDAYKNQSFDDHIVSEKSWILLVNANILIENYDTALELIRKYLRSEPEKYYTILERHRQQSEKNNEMLRQQQERLLKEKENDLLLSDNNESSGVEDVFDNDDSEELLLSSMKDEENELLLSSTKDEENE